MKIKDLFTFNSEKRAYLKLVRYYRKRLVKLAKQSAPFDFGFGLDYFIEFLKFMRDYYKDGNWVSAMENCDAFNSKELTRKEQLDEAISEYEAYENVINEYTIFHDTGNPNKGVEKHDWWIEPKLSNIKENSEAIQKAEEAHWNKFWLLVNTNLRNWWD